MPTQDQCWDEFWEVVAHGLVQMEREGTLVPPPDAGAKATNSQKGDGHKKQ